MAQVRATGRNIASVVSLIVLFLYIGFFTSELYSRLNNIQKLQRLHQYEQEVIIFLAKIIFLFIFRPT